MKSITVLKCTKRKLPPRRLAIQRIGLKRRLCRAIAVAISQPKTTLFLINERFAVTDLFPVISAIFASKNGVTYFPFTSEGIVSSAFSTNGSI